MPKYYVHMARVTVGFGGFPVDMLRYDQCFPATEQDAGKIERRNSRSVSDVGDGTRQVEVHQISVDRKPRWTRERWGSFACEVQELGTRRLET